jgi:hypothetical protein
MKWLRRLLLELWALLVASGVVGFMGPFGTYLTGDFLARAWSWASLLFGAYVLARPAMLFWSWMARTTRLPQGPTVFWGMILSSLPLAFVWRKGRTAIYGAPDTSNASLIGGYAGIFSFTILCCLLVMLVAWWAERADAHLFQEDSVGDVPAPPPPDSAEPPTPAPSRPRLHNRLSPGFHGDILALESEDHYVRVHSLRGNELLHIRLRDAIAEMDGRPGEQIHRSWWVARGAVAGVHSRGRGCEVRLLNGERAPVARDSVERLTRSQFLPAGPAPVRAG